MLFKVTTARTVMNGMAAHPGRLSRIRSKILAWPVTPDQATGALEDFVVNRASFGA